LDRRCLLLGDTSATARAWVLISANKCGIRIRLLSCRTHRCSKVGESPTVQAMVFGSDGSKPICVYPVSPGCGRRLWAVLIAKCNAAAAKSPQPQATVRRQQEARGRETLARSAIFSIGPILLVLSAMCSQLRMEQAVLSAIVVTSPHNWARRHPPVEPR
jgi:hypothetical protein